MKRLAASLEIAGRDNDSPQERARDRAELGAPPTGRPCASFAEQSMLDVWYARLDMDELLPRFHSVVGPEATPSVWHAIANAAGARQPSGIRQAVPRSWTASRASWSDPPLIVPIDDLSRDRSGR